MGSLKKSQIADRTTLELTFQFTVPEEQSSKTPLMPSCAHDRNCIAALNWSLRDMADIRRVLRPAKTPLEVVQPLTFQLLCGIVWNPHAALHSLPQSGGELLGKWFKIKRIVVLHQRVPGERDVGRGSC